MRLIRKLLIVLSVTGLILLIGHELKHYLPNLEAWISKMGIFAPLGFVLLFVVLSPIFVSIDALCFAAGVLFPIVPGELVIFVATYLSAALIFFLGRYLLRTHILNYITKHKRFAMLDSVISSDNALKLMFLLRLTPLPFAMLSYVLSVTQVKFWPYLLATTGILIYNSSLVYLGYTTKHLTGITGQSHANAIPHSMLGLGLAMLLLVLILIAKIAGNTLKQLQVVTPKE
jgi:uncharacterized membrane protein YdjX (TVP38/TMEM64 family)